MDKLLTETKDQLSSDNFTTLNIVLGNESCDLDSAVSALVYATFLKWQYDQLKCKVCTKDKRGNGYKDEAFVPILNVDREDYPIKTEVVHCLQEFGVNASNLVFRDDHDWLNLSSTHETKVVLVDHHVLAIRDQQFTDQVVEIIDHRPLNKTSWSYKQDARSTIETVGSCATLIAKRIKDLTRHNVEFYAQYGSCADMLHSCIILDTVNFSKEVNKGTPQDEEMILYLEGFMKPENVQQLRSLKLNNLVSARTDVSKLTPENLIKKDMKIVGDILVPSFPILVENLLSKDNVKESVEIMLTKHNCTIALLLGMKLDGASVERDAAIFSADEHYGRARQLSTLLQEWTSPKLDLAKEDLNKNFVNLIYFKQLNKQASRKQYMTALNEFIKK